jgi:hypothetical protein
MPHVNLLYPFLPAERFRPSMLTALHDALKDVRPFSVRLDAFDHFVHGKGATFFLPPTNVRLGTLFVCSFRNVVYLAS